MTAEPILFKFKVLFILYLRTNNLLAFYLQFSSVIFINTQLPIKPFWLLNPKCYNIFCKILKNLKIWKAECAAKK